MPILNGPELRKRIVAGWLILNASMRENGEPDVQAASYDLRSGIALWKDKSSHELKSLFYDQSAPHQPVVTLLPGQMVFVITHEELSLPPDVCGTVYSRNRLQKQNILALNAGHVDPGYRGPIIIRLINLGQTEWPLTLGDAVFTVVFHTVEPVGPDQPQDIRSKTDTLLAAQQTAAQAFSNPLHDLYTDELKKQFDEYKSELLRANRETLGKEFFSKDDIWKVVAAIVVSLYALFKIPWADLFNTVRAFLIGK
jgi:deoxycytidine triphosphate deaminase